MGRDNSPRERQQRKLERKASRRASYDRILIVSEGTKTEPQYFDEIRATYKLHTANVVVQPGELGTEPIKVFQYARQLFERGDSNKRIQPRSFEKVYVVFDRDSHRTYFDALAACHDCERRLRNDLREPVQLKAVASVPNFEFWLLLHFEDVRAPLERDEVYRRLRAHMPDYEKGKRGMFSRTAPQLEAATARATRLQAQFSPHNGTDPYTGVHELVSTLLRLKQS